MASSQMVPAKDRVNNVRALLEKSKAQIAMALPRHMTSERMMRVAMTEIQKNPMLLDCHPLSLVAAVVQAAQLGLEIGILGQAYLVPFKNNKKGRMEVQLIPGYRGLVQLARRSGEIVTFEARVVHARDTFKVAYGLEGGLWHTPHMPAPESKEDVDPGAVIAAYAFAKFKDGGFQYEVMSLRELKGIRARSKASDSGPWVTDTEEMYRKTVARRLCKWLPASIELATAVDLDNKANEGIAQDLDVIDVSAEAPEGEDVETTDAAEPEASKLDKATEALKAQAQTPEATGAPVVDCQHSAVRRFAREPHNRNRLMVCGDCTLTLKVSPDGTITVDEA